MKYDKQYVELEHRVFSDCVDAYGNAVNFYFFLQISCFKRILWGFHICSVCGEKLSNVFVSRIST